MGTFAALVLGIVQGLTEFLPVSSTAHLYIAQALLGVPNDAMTLSFDVVLHLGTLLALLLVTWRLLAGLMTELALWLARRPARDATSRGLLLPLVIGTVPGALAGLFLLKRFEELRTPALIGSAMLVACAFFLYAERRARILFGASRDRSQIRLTDGLWMGIAQAAAGLMAGFSRSGLTISTGRARGLARDESARFSFLLAVPIILGAGAKTLLDLRKQPEAAIGSSELAVGFVAAAVVGYAAARFLLRYLRIHDLRPFALYLGLLGTVLVAVSVARGDPFLARPDSRSSASRSQKLSTEAFRAVHPASATAGGGSEVLVNQLDTLGSAAGVRLAKFPVVELRLKMVPAPDAGGDCTNVVEVLEGKQEFLADLLTRLNEIIRKPDGRYMVVYDPETHKPRRVLKLN